MHATHKHTNNKWTIITINQTCMRTNSHISDSILTINQAYNKWTIITINQTCMLLTSILTISGL